MNVIVLSGIVLSMLQHYIRQIEDIPDKYQRASMAQSRRSASVLFGVARLEDCNSNSHMLEMHFEDLTVHLWSLMRAYEKAVWRLPDQLQEKEADVAYSFFLETFRILVNNSSGMKIVSLEGRRYDGNYPVETINSEKLTEEIEELVVSEMLEPIIMNKDGKPIRFGKILVSHVGDEI